MTESGTTPPPRSETPIRPAAGRPPHEGELSGDAFGFRRRELIELESLAERAGLRPSRGEAGDLWAREPSYPPGIVRGETHTALLGKTGGVPVTALPKVVVREETDPAAAPERLDLGARFFEDAELGDELVIGGPEPADWVRLADPRTAPTEPSLRRRVKVAPPFSPEAPTPIEPSSERRRERLRSAVAVGLGALVAVIGLSSLLVTSIVPRDHLGAVPPPSPVRAIEAARTAVLPDDIPPPPVLAAEGGEPLPSVITEEPLATVVPRPAERSDRRVAPPPAQAPVVPIAAPVSPDSGEPSARAGATARKPLPIARVQSGLTKPSTRSGAPASIPRASSSSSAQPKKRLWFPPE